MASEVLRCGQGGVPTTGRDHACWRKQWALPGSQVVDDEEMRELRRPRNPHRRTGGRHSVPAKWDTIIVGGGPAGSTLGYELASKGVRALILEKESFPRYKTCAGGLSIKAADCLGFDLGSVIENTIFGGHITFRMGEGFTMRFPQPLAFTVSREAFDQLLLQRAVEAGCVVHEEAKVDCVEIGEREVAVRSGRRRYLARTVVGADGANSVVARSAGLMKDVGTCVGIEAEVEVDGASLERWHDLVLLDFGGMPHGYGWIFPKRDHLSIGVCSPRAYSRELRDYGQAFHRMWSKALGHFRVIRKGGRRLPVRRIGGAIQRGRALLVGDAAGLFDPCTGEGIHHAVVSARLAAQVLERHLATPEGTPLSDYETLVDATLMPEIQRAKAFGRIFDLSPRIFLGALKRGSRLWNIACRLCRGETTYVAEGKRLGPLEFILDRMARQP